MLSSNQINAIVPVPPASVFTAPGPNAWVQIQQTTLAAGGSNNRYTDWFPITVVQEDPGIFTFGGLGQGQAAVLNYDTVNGYSINSAKNPAPKGSTISLYATGMGDLLAGVVIKVTDSSTPPQTSLGPSPYSLIINPAPASTSSLTILSGGLPAGTQNIPYRPGTLQ